MSEPNYLDIEQRLNITIPPHFLKFVNEESSKISELLELAENEENIFISQSTSWLTSANLESRDHTSGKFFLPGVIVIGHDGAGNLIVISENVDDLRVWVVDFDYIEDFRDAATKNINWDHEDMEVYDTLNEFVSEQIEMLQELDEDWD